MVYLQTSAGKALIILEPANVEELTKEDGVVTSPLGEVAIVYCPDVQWLHDQFKVLTGGDLSKLSPDKLIELLKQASKRAPVSRQPGEVEGPTVFLNKNFFNDMGGDN